MRLGKFRMGIALVLSLGLHFSLLALGPVKKDFKLAPNPPLKIRLTNPVSQLKAVKSPKPVIKKKAPEKDSLILEKPEEIKPESEQEDFSSESVSDHAISEINGYSDFLSNYLNLVISKIQKAKRYPLQARKEKIEGEVKLKFLINSRGELESAELVSSSGFEILDREALEMLHRAVPFPPLPEEIKERGLELNLKVKFHLEEY